MRKSRDVPLTILAALALSSTACRDQPREARNCVDAQGRIVPDSNCDHQPHGGVGYIPVYRYVYGGASGGHEGDAVVGGRSSPSSGEEGVSRGGFGHGGGEGEGGGE
jgi:hypothetical protein